MGEQFDDFTRALARGASRREAVKALAAGAGAVLVTWLGAGRAEAGDEGAEGTCRPNDTPCRFRRQCCSKRCVDFACRCRDVGLGCRSSAQCCSNLCEKAACNCRGFKEPCSSDAQCCQDVLSDAAGRGRRPRPGGGGGPPKETLNLTCQSGVCTCSFSGDSCSETDDCCFEDNICVKGTCCLGEGAVCFNGDCCLGLSCVPLAAQAGRPGASGLTFTCQSI